MCIYIKMHLYLSYNRLLLNPQNNQTPANSFASFLIPSISLSLTLIDNNEREIILSGLFSQSGGGNFRLLPKYQISLSELLVKNDNNLFNQSTFV